MNTVNDTATCTGALAMNTPAVIHTDTNPAPTQGQVLTVSATTTDGTTATAQVTVGATGPP
jgi:hypothetical protein